MKNRSRLVTALSGFLIVGSLIQSGCGYRVATRNRLSPEARTVAVVPLQNETTIYEVEQFLTRALVRALVEKTAYQVQDRPDEADLVLEGTVTRVTANPVTFGRTAFGSTYLVTLNARLRVTDRRTSQTIFQNNNFIFREQYVINVDVENFFTELNPALERIAVDFSSSIVATLLENF